MIENGQSKTRTLFQSILWSSCYHYIKSNFKLESVLEKSELLITFFYSSNNIAVLVHLIDITTINKKEVFSRFEN